MMVYIGLFIAISGQIFLVALLLMVCWMLFLNGSPYAYKHRSTDETCFLDENCEPYEFPSLSENPTLDLSIIIPAYNEEHRLRPMLDSCLQWMLEVDKRSFEVIIVSDGSTDKTCDVVMEYVAILSTDIIRLLKLNKNRGKGGAVCLGMQYARGRKLLFADADGATKFEDLVKLENALQIISDSKVASYGNSNSDICAVICGSRSHLESESVAQRSVFRTLLMIGFQMHVWMFGVRSIKDTQCGFKLFTRSAAKILFNNIHVDGWAFDVEMLYIAERCNMYLAEVAVNWTEIEGSKIIPVWSWIQMGFDVLAIWIKYRTGTWKIRYEKID